MSDSMGFEDALRIYGGDESELIRVLQAAQREYSCISPETALRISEAMNVPLSRIYGVVTFYRQFTLSRPGRHLIRLCSGTACHVGGSSGLEKVICGILGVEPGGTTEDGRFTLDSAACLGCCSLAPVMMVDGVVYGRLDESSVRDILESFD